MLLRDIVIDGKYQELLENITLLFIPIFNVDGNERFGPYNRINQNGPEEMGWRTNARNLNLNRDFLKADTKEMQHFLELWNHWQPDFYIDTHATNGGDYQYPMTYIIEIFGGMEQGLTDWCAQDFLPEWEQRMEASGYPSFPYVTYRNWHDPRSGLVSRTSPPALMRRPFTCTLQPMPRPRLLLRAPPSRADAGSSCARAARLAFQPIISAVLSMH